MKREVALVITNNRSTALYMCAESTRGVWVSAAKALSVAGADRAPAKVLQAATQTGARAARLSWFQRPSACRSASTWLSLLGLFVWLLGKVET